MRPDWMSRAACREYDPDAWYPEDAAEAAVAQRICERCPVRVECLAYADAHDERYGVWGGQARGRRSDGMCQHCHVVAIAGYGVRYCADCRVEVRREQQRRYEQRVRLYGRAAS